MIQTRDGITVDVPSGKDDPKYVVIDDEGMLYPLPQEWTVYDTENW